MSKNDFENIIDSGDTFENLMETKTENKKSDLDVLKELFKKNDIELKTDLKINQIIQINKLRAIAKLLNFKQLDYVLNDFMVLSVSKDRLGRKEFIEGFKGRQDREENLMRNNNANDSNRLFGK